MANIEVRPPQCNGRACFHHYSGMYPRKIKGAFLKPDCSYCTGGRKIQIFKQRETKQTPSWCPLRIIPCILRIYQYKDSNTRLFHLLASFKSTIRRPYGGDYALRYEGTIPLNPVGFHEMIHTRPLEQILEIPVEVNEVIEIYDGLTPYYFWAKDIFSLSSIPFDGEKARLNTLEVD